MKVFCIHFDTESGDHWTDFVLAESKKEITNSLTKADKMARKKMGLDEEAHNCCYFTEIKEVKTITIEEFENAMIEVYEQEIN